MIKKPFASFNPDGVEPMLLGVAGTEAGTILANKSKCAVSEK